MAISMNLTVAIQRAWERIAQQTHTDLGKEILSADEVRLAVRQLLDSQFPGSSTHRMYWKPLKDAEKTNALERAFPEGPYWMLEEMEEAD